MGDKKEKKLPHIPKNSEKTTNNDMLKAYKVIQEKIKMQTFLKKELEKGGAEFLGVILNKVNSNELGYGGYYGHYGSYGIKGNKDKK